MNSVLSNEIIFNPKTISDAGRVKKYLNKINKAERNDIVEYNEWIEENGKTCYILDSIGIDYSKSNADEKACIRTWDFLVQGEKPNTFHVYSLQMDYKSRLIFDGPQKDEWVKQQIKENPNADIEDFQYIGIYESHIKKSAIYNGKDHYFESSYYGTKSNSLSVIGELYLQLRHEIAFQPIKDIFFEHVVPPSDQKAIKGRQLYNQIVSKHIQQTSR